MMDEERRGDLADRHGFSLSGWCSQELGEAPLAACQPALDAFVQVPGSCLGPQSPWAAAIPLSSNLEPPRAKPSLMYFWGPGPRLATRIRSWSRMNGCGGFQGMPSVYIVCVCNCVSSGLQVCVCLNVCCLRGCYICTFACV